MLLDAIAAPVHPLLCRFPCIVADPPWPLKWQGGPAVRRNGRGERHVNTKFKKSLPYPTMTVDQICRLDVESVAADAAHLYLWAPDRWIISGEAAQVCRAWGFEPLRLIVWARRGFGLGHFPRPQHEALIVAKRGKLRFLANDIGSVHVWTIPYVKSGRSAGRVHSRKPDDFLGLVERASPGPRLELFARRKREGWAAWGNEIESDVEIRVRSVSVRSLDRPA